MNRMVLKQLRSKDMYLTFKSTLQFFSPENIAFQEKILERSGLGDETGLSDGAPQFCKAADPQGTMSFVSFNLCVLCILHGGRCLPLWIRIDLYYNSPLLE